MHVAGCSRRVQAEGVQRRVERVAFTAVLLASCHGATPRQPLAEHPVHPGSPSPAIGLPFFVCKATGDTVALVRQPATNHVVRDVQLSRPGAIVDAIVRAGAPGEVRVQLLASSSDGRSVTTLATRDTRLTLAQPGDDASYAASTPWRLDGVWTDGALLHREANETGCELLWGPRDGDVTKLAYRCGFGITLRSEVVGDRLVLLDASDVGVATTFSFDGRERTTTRVQHEPRTEVVIARYRQHAALAVVDPERLPLVRIISLDGGAEETVSLDLGPPMHACTQAPRPDATTLMGVHYEWTNTVNEWPSSGALQALDAVVEGDHACVSRVRAESIVIYATEAGLIGLDDDVALDHARILRCEATGAPPPTD